tara:strand:- start:268 stop:528 length:261 start_codon:yes stop_codon:yes gene_type:complete
MKLIKRIGVDLSDFKNKNRTGHISEYILKNGNRYFLYFLEMKYFGFKKTDCDGKILESGCSEDEHDYRIDIYFEDRDRQFFSQTFL